MRIGTLFLPAALILGGCGWFQSAPTPSETGGAKPNPAPPEQPIAETKPVKQAPRKIIRHVAPADAQPAPQEDAQLKDRFITVSAKCQSAEESYNQLKADSAQTGRALHPDISTAYFRMKTSLDMAKRELEGHQDPEARHSLDVAELSATKVLRAAGGH